MPKKFIPMFPPFLDKESSGDAVDFLSRALIGMGFMPKEEFESGKYPSEAVKRLQASVYVVISKDKIDENFGPETRKATSNLFDFDLVPATPGKITLWYGPNHKDAKEWPPKEE